MPHYARFLNDLCSIKRATSVPKKAFVDFSASFIISHHVLVMYEVLSCSNITPVIGDQLIHRVLLDIEVSANLFPFIGYGSRVR